MVLFASVYIMCWRFAYADRVYEWVKGILVVFAQTYAFIVMKTRLKFILILTVQNSWYNVAYLFVLKPWLYDKKTFFEILNLKNSWYDVYFFLSNPTVWQKIGYVFFLLVPTGLIDSTIFLFFFPTAWIFFPQNFSSNDLYSYGPLMFHLFIFPVIKKTSTSPIKISDSCYSDMLVVAKFRGQGMHMSIHSVKMNLRSF